MLIIKLTKCHGRTDRYDPPMLLSFSIIQLAIYKKTFTDVNKLTLTNSSCRKGH